MSEPPKLSKVSIAYAPLIDKHRQATAMRLSLRTMPDEARPRGAALIRDLEELWPADAGRVCLSLDDDDLLLELLAAKPASHVMVEVPARVAAEPVHADGLRALHRRGNALVLRDLHEIAVPPPVMANFAYSIVDITHERRDGIPPPGGVTRKIPHVQSGISKMQHVNEAFARGAIAVLGWPDDVVVDVKDGARHSNVQLIAELINRVNKGESADRLEAVIRTEPTLAFRLMRYINSAAFGLSVEVSSFRHAILLLGHNQLKRWLALLLASSSKDPNVKPIMLAAVRRGFLMEELVRGAFDPDQRAEMYLCGVFSLLDRMMGMPVDKLLASIQVPDAVREALIDGAGPYQPYLRLVRAADGGDVGEIRQAAEALFMTPADVNRAVIRALVSARAID